MTPARFAKGDWVQKVVPVELREQRRLSLPRSRPLRFNRYLDPSSPEVLDAVETLRNVVDGNKIQWVVVDYMSSPTEVAFSSVIDVSGLELAREEGVQ